MPSDLISGVPASIQFTPPLIASSAICKALCKFTKSRAICNTGALLLHSKYHSKYF